MRHVFGSLLLPAFAILLQGCLNEDEPCDRYRLISMTNMADGGEVTFTYNTEGLLQRVSDLNQAEDNFFYDGAGQLIRIEQTSEAMPKNVLLFDSDAKGRVISRYADDNFPGDSMVFEYDDKDRMTKATRYSWGSTEIFFYYDIEYPDASTVKNTVYLRGQYTPELSLSVIYIYKIDNHPRPHPQEYYLSQELTDQYFIPHNVLSKRLTSPNGTTVGEVITHTYSYNGRGYPTLQDMVLKYAYGCE